MGEYWMNWQAEAAEYRDAPDADGALGFDYELWRATVDAAALAQSAPADDDLAAGFDF